MISPFFTTNYDVWHLLPTLSLCLERCPDPRCQSVHGISLVASFLCFHAGVTIPFKV